MTAPFNLPEGYQELLPTPGDNDALQPGDEVWLCFDLLYGMGGDWFVGYQIDELDKKLSADGRWLLLAWSYDQPNGQVWFRLRANENAVETDQPVQQAGIFTLLTVGTLCATILAILYWISERRPERRAYRKMEAQEAIQASNLPQPTKDALSAELNGRMPGKGGLLGAVVLVAVVLMILAWAKR